MSREAGFSRSSLYKWKRKRIEGYKQMKAEKKKAAGKRELTEAEKDNEEA